jgi:hypothetical protein
MSNSVVILRTGFPCSVMVNLVKPSYMRSKLSMH